ncbi:MAG: hypothetical protein KDK30_14740 [Leptospiraceae bacterium]|nr:hypothetical protein [Leptospiraceae bacterium]MCB1316646.1 hypothetical protein [Leptospiraceae bacterium]
MLGEKINYDAELDPELIQRLADYLRDHQSLWRAIVGGVLGGIGGVLFWLLITHVLEREVTLMAIPLGFFVANGIRRFGRGIDDGYGYAGASIVLIGAIIAHFASLLILEARFMNLTLAETLESRDLFSIFAEHTGNLDYFFVLLSCWMGYRFSFYRVKESEVETLIDQFQKNQNP